MKKLIIIAISITILNSCGTKKGITRLGTPIINIEQSLLKGEIRLECDVACSGSYGYIMKKLKRLYEGSLWLELVKEVVNNGHRSDESYFYLARSAEELGSIDAAYEYYKLAKYSTPCKSPTVNNCNGFSFPADIDYRLEKIRSIKDTDKKMKEINQEYNKENIKKEPEKPAAPSVSSEAPAQTFVEANFKANYLLNPKPEYPTIAKSRGWQGKVMLRVQVSSEGTVSDVSVETSSGHEMLDASALEAVNKWKFIPAKRGNNAVASWVIVPIIFTLNDEPGKPIETQIQEINKQNSDIKSQVKIKKKGTDKKEASKKITKDNSKKTVESSAKENIEPQKTQDIKENQQSLDKKEPIKIKSFFDL
jgi:protein TonB